MKLASLGAREKKSETMKEWLILYVCVFLYVCGCAYVCKYVCVCASMCLSVDVN